VMLLKIMKRNIAEVMHPQKVKTVRLSGKPVSEKILANTNAYFAAICNYFAVIVLKEPRDDDRSVQTARVSENDLFDFFVCRTVLS